MFCKNCGGEIEEGKKFCPKCGQDLSKKVEDSTESIGSSHEVHVNNNSKVTPILKIIYRLSILVFGVLLMSQSLVSCGHKGYECFIDTFKSDSCLMVSSSDVIYGINHGGVGAYVISFITILYVWLLLLSLIQKDSFWKKNLHTNLFIPIILGVTAYLYNRFGDSNFKPTNYVYICIGISVFITVIYIIVNINTKVEFKKYSVFTRLLILIVLQIIYMYVFGAIIPFIHGNIS